MNAAPVREREINCRTSSRAGFIPGSSLTSQKGEEEGSSRVDELEVPRPSGTLIYYLSPLSCSGGNHKKRRPVGNWGAVGRSAFFSRRDVYALCVASKVFLRVTQRTEPRALLPGANSKTFPFFPAFYAGL